jgi:hypothetical protein
MPNLATESSSRPKTSTEACCDQADERGELGVANASLAFCAIGKRRFETDGEGKLLSIIGIYDSLMSSTPKHQF